MKFPNIILLVDISLNLTFNLAYQIDFVVK